MDRRNFFGTIAAFLSWARADKTEADLPITYRPRGDVAVSPIPTIRPFSFGSGDYFPAYDPALLARQCAKAYGEEFSRSLDRYVLENYAETTEVKLG